MAVRKPAHIQMIGGVSPRQRIWEAIRRLRRFSFDELRGELPGAINRATIRSYLKDLEAASHVAPVTIDGRPGWQLIRDAGLDAPRVRKDGTTVTQGLAQEQMWRTLRMLGGEHTPRQLAAHASTPEVRVTEAAAADYLGWLTRAGYLNRSGKGRKAKYRLIPAKWTGPRAPMIQRVKQVYDPNVGRVVWSPTHATEAADGSV